MKKKKFSERFKYWFDNCMSKGTAVMIAMLAFVAFLIVIIVTLAIFLGGWNEEGGFFYTLWDVLATTINAWMPASGDGGIQYIGLISISAILGVFFTSFLIGIISTAVEDKLSQLRAGNSKVVEEGHIVVLGFKPGEYTLLTQLILSLGDEKKCIVVAEEEEKEKMEELIKDNVDIPKNVRVICRNADITDPVGLECCSMEDASLVVVNPILDNRTIKILLAVSTYFGGKTEKQPRVVSAVELAENCIPYSVRKKYGFTMVRTNNAVARIIARSCTQQGLSKAFMEVFSFEGNELHIEDIEYSEGRRFKDLMYFMEKAVPLGIYRDGETLFNPPRNTELKPGDKLIVFEEEKGSIALSDEKYIELAEDEGSYEAEAPAAEKVLIIGSNAKLKEIINELPAYVKEVTLAGIRHLEEKQAMCREIRSDIEVSIINEDVKKQGVLERITENADHVILLSDYSMEEEEADARNIIVLLNLRDIKERLGRKYTITSEMRRDDNRTLINCDDETEFIVSSNMGAMVLSQIAVSAELYEVFHELLSNDGNNFMIKPASFIDKCIGVDRTFAEIRRELLHKQFILLGLIEEKDGRTNTILNPKISEIVRLNPEDKLIVIGK